MRQIFWVALCAGCATLHDLPREQPCYEAGYAISSRTFECSGDADLANQRYHQFQSEYECVPVPEWHLDTGIAGTYIQGGTGGVELLPQDAFHCAFAIRQIPCELVEEYGDDLARYLASSDACTWIVKPKGGKP